MKESSGNRDLSGTEVGELGESLRLLGRRSFLQNSWAWVRRVGPRFPPF
jgi:hypothetical protein